MNSIRSTKPRVSASAGPATEESASHRSSFSPSFDGLPEFHASTPVTASSTKDTPRTRKGQRIESPHKRVRASSESSQNRPASEATSSAQHLLSAAFRVVLAAGWITPLKSVKQLQLASLSICRDCRETTGFHIRVVIRTPRRLWTDKAAIITRQNKSMSRTGNGGVAGSSSVPAIRAEELTFGEHYERALGRVALPPSLKSVNFGKRFDKSVDGVRFPPTLVRIGFGCHFNQGLVGMAFPAGLRSLTFGCRFNQALDGVPWNAGLQELSLGGGFNQPVGGVRWPPSLKVLAFGCEFRQSMENVHLPRGLETLDMGHRWNDSIATLRLPDGLTNLRLGNKFNQPLDRVQFPRGLSGLRFGDSFNQPLNEVRFPPGLEKLQFGDSFSQSLDGVRWPRTLKEVHFGRAMSEEEVNDADWPHESLALMVVGDRTLVEKVGKWLVDKFCR